MANEFTTENPPQPDDYTPAAMQFRADHPELFPPETAEDAPIGEPPPADRPFHDPTTGDASNHPQENFDPNATTEPVDPKAETSS